MNEVKERIVKIAQPIADQGFRNETFCEKVVDSLDNRHGGYWACISGDNFKVSHQTHPGDSGFFRFKIDGMNYHIFRPRK